MNGLDLPAFVLGINLEMSEFTYYRAVMIGAGTAISLLILLGIYVRFRIPLQRWIATLRMKSLFWKDRRKRVRNSKKS
jgi:hypothetical protein